MVKKAFAVIVVAAVLALVLYRMGIFEYGTTIKALIPDEAAPGELVTLSGPNLLGVKDVSVRFNEVAVAPQDVYVQGLTVRVPEGARSGLVSIAYSGSVTNGVFFKVLPPRTAADDPQPNLPKGHPELGGGMGGGMGGMMGGGMPPKQVQAPGSAPQEAAETPNAHEFYDAATAKDAADFTLKDAKGVPHRLSDYKGKVIALNFWATWCPPCLEEVPSLERLTKRASVMDLVVLAVSVDKSFDDVKKALPNTALNVLLDPTSEVANRYGTMKFPETWIIDKRGKIVARFIGSRDWDSPLFERLFGMLIKGEGLPGGGGMGMGH